MQESVLTSKSESYLAARRLTHLNFFVNDIDRSVEFYRDIVGLGVAWRREAMRTGFLTNGNTHHDIGLIDVTSPISESTVPALFHIAFELETQVDLVEGFRAARDDGFEFTAMYDHEIAHSVYCRDPSGTLVEIYADTDVNWKERIVNPAKPRLTPWFPGADEPSHQKFYDPQPAFRYDPSALFHATRVTHVVLAVDAIEEVAAFYSRVCGLKPVAGSPEQGYLTLAGSTGERGLTLIEANGNKGFRHVGFAALDRDGLKSSIAQAERKGLDIVSVADTAGRLSAIIRDPDGFNVQLYVDGDAPPSGPASAGEPLASHLY